MPDQDTRGMTQVETVNYWFPIAIGVVLIVSGAWRLVAWSWTGDVPLIGVSVDTLLGVFYVLFGICFLYFAPKFRGPSSSDDDPDERNP